MILRKYKLVIKHDKGKLNLYVTSSNKESAIKIAMICEGCPRCAILSCTRTGDK